MQKASVRSKRASGRKSGRASFDKSGRAVWEWQTSTGVFEQQISDEQLANLEDSQLTIVERPPPPSSVSYFEFRERSPTAKTFKPPQKQADTGPLQRLFSRFLKI